MQFLSLTLSSGQTEDVGLSGHKSTVITGMMMSFTPDMNVILCLGRYLQNYRKEKKDSKSENLIFFVTL